MNRDQEKAMFAGQKKSGHGIKSTDLDRSRVVDSEGNIIPKAPYYVTTTDTFMSGWGNAEAKTNKLIIPTSSYEEAEIVADNARQRSDQKNINIVQNKPSYNLNNYYVQVKTKESFEPWFKQNNFRNQKHSIARMNRLEKFIEDNGHKPEVLDALFLKAGVVVEPVQGSKVLGFYSGLKGEDRQKVLRAFES